MTVHAVEIVASTQQEDKPSNVPAPEPPSLPNVVPDRVKENVFDKFTEALPEQASKLSKVEASEITSFDVAHLRGRYRVVNDATKAKVLDAFENNVVIDAKWYEIRYHQCDHDEDNKTGCNGFTVERSKGTVPDGV